MAKISLNKKGLSIATAIIVVVIVALVSTYGYEYYQRLCLSLGRLNNRFTAVNLTVAQIEDIIAMNWDDPNIDTTNGPISKHKHTLTKPGQPDPVPAGFNLTYSVEVWLPGTGTIGAVGAIQSPCKRLIATCTYPPNNNAVQSIAYKVKTHI